MVCSYCRQNIGLLRRLKDQQFCCDEHRQKLASRSARALREAEDMYGFDENRLPTWRSITQVKPEDKAERRSGYGATIFASIAVVFLLLALSQLPSGSPGRRSASPLPDASSHRSQGGMGQMLTSLIQSQASGNLREDFSRGFTDWEGLKQTGLDWSQGGGDVRPAGLRVWKRSTTLSNYEMEFMGRIERKSMDWAFRAPDLRNYYATKLVITKPGPLPNAGLVRFIVLDGRERERVELPLPLTLERDTDYRVRVSVRGDHFLTSVNGQLVSSWTDNRLSRGGIGFFSEDGESSVVKWVSLSERDSFLARIVSHFSLISFPTSSLAALP